MKTEKIHAGEFLVSESNGYRSRETVTIAQGHDLLPGTVLGVETADGEYAPYAAGAADGTETAAGILYAAVDSSAEGTNAPTAAVIIARDSEVSEEMLTGFDEAARPELAALGIIVR